MNETTKNKIINLFFDPKIGFTSINRFNEKLKENKITITNKELEMLYKSLAVNQVLKPYRKPKKYSSIVAHYCKELYQIDIMVYDRYKYGYYSYIISVIDVYSRYAEARAMTNRRSETVLEKLKEIFSVMKVPEKIECDNEFNTKILDEYFKKNNISLIFSLPEQINKNAIVERFNGTLANLLQKIRIGTNNKNWPSYLKDAIYNYNNTVHSTIKETPISIWTYKKRNQQKINIVANPFKIGDKVRIVRKKKVFDKGDVIKLSTDIYIIENINGKKIFLNGIKRHYKPYELSIIKDIQGQPINEPETETKANNAKKLMKRLELDPDNIIVGKRIRK